MMKAFKIILKDVYYKFESKWMMTKVLSSINFVYFTGSTLKIYNSFGSKKIYAKPNIT